jgi:hypothetical protein
LQRSKRRPSDHRKNRHSQIVLQGLDLDALVKDETSLSNVVHRLKGLFFMVRIQPHLRPRMLFGSVRRGAQFPCQIVVALQSTKRSVFEVLLSALIPQSQFSPVKRNTF